MPKGLRSVSDVQHVAPFQDIQPVYQVDRIHEGNLDILRTWTAEPEAYLDFFRTFSLKPETCFFIDDTPANIEAAGNLGMDGCVYYGDVDELRRCLQEKLL